MERRERWGLWAVVIAVLSALGGMAIAMGITTPAARLDKQDSRLDELEPRVDKVEQRQNDMSDDVAEIKTDVKMILRRMPK